ncbi:hypothetical protein R70723_04555 [Paenibacillus sp. FSL R7-0273]|uniref:hypothetical protein n=1 Tax=Paenibacillus sp. FSL R7-0273 TaxID=1536772 RepID=UPI0004F802DF|nr:hypothetical protein [Paenibacillus sp. FSL R7-0273]AIQ45245.1 hypothetical protein R70723_04555 [Paenibacillus sp. FSL R7-0273]OMF88866.1 hypothetical protein BK144_20560 [Paenibacillus sp. FSL R7-0273]
MEWLNDYELELQAVFQECKAAIAGFPEPLGSRGLAYLEQFDVFRARSKKNYICYLLPFWLRRECGLSPEETHIMSTGNVLLMLYFFLQDDLMDNRRSSAAELLPLANLLYSEFLDRYRPLFPAESSFWSHFKRYLFEWSDSVSNEASGDYYYNDRSRIAGKAAPLKLSAAAALLLTGLASSIPAAEEAVQEVLITLQMLDDYEDWEEDLEEGSYNCLLALARRHLYPDHPQAGITAAEARNFIYTAGGLKTYAAAAADNHERLLAGTFRISGLTAFHQMLADNLQRIAAAVEAEKEQLLGGGLQYWLSKHMKSQEFFENSANNQKKS